VRCTHGATVGPLEEEQIFYALARGIDRVDAEQLIVEGFFQPLMDKIPLESIREALIAVVHQKIAGDDLPSP
jgi:Fe-S cluster assembly protein SufD